MNKLIKIILIALLSFTLQSCRWITDAHGSYASWLIIKSPPGTDAFRQGFKDGCSSIMYARGNMFYRMRYSYRFDPKLSKNPEYMFGVKRAITFCFYQTIFPSSGFHASWDKALFPHKTANGYAYGTDMAAKNYNEATGGMFNGLDGTVNTTAGNGFDGIFEIWKGSMAADPLWAGGSQGQFFGQ